MEKVSTDNDKVNWESVLNAEIVTFGLLGKILYTFPDKSWILSLVDQELFQSIPLETDHPDVIAGLELLQAWIVETEYGEFEDNFQELKLDYTRLFIGVDRVLAPPWESVHLNNEHLLFQEQTLQVRSWYSQFGWEVIQRKKEPDDHIAVELNFLSRLAQLGLQALEVKDRAAFEKTLEAQRRFMSEHLLKWVFLWRQQVIQHSQTKFFKGVALLTTGVIQEFAQILRPVVGETK